MKRNRKQFIGTVISDKMNKTRVVLVERAYRDKLYNKVVRTTKKYYAHDEKNLFHTGNKVKIVESKPISKTKRWIIIGGVRS